MSHPTEVDELVADARRRGQRATLAYQRRFTLAAAELQNPDGPQTPKLAGFKNVMKSHRGRLIPEQPLPEERCNELCREIDRFEATRRVQAFLQRP